MKRPPLHRLPDGSWIDLAQVRSISPLPGANCIDLEPRVQIDIGFELVSVYFKTLEEAQTYADELAEIRNSYDLES